MTRSFSLLLGSLAIMGGCPSSGPVGAETTEGSTSQDPTAESSTSAAHGSSTMVADDTVGDTAADTTADTGPSGPCPLEGMFEPCTIAGTEGTAYCDEIDGELQWGPCLPSLACELGQSLPGCQSCTLIEGVPTVEGSANCACDGPVGAPQCEQTECVQRWDYSCGSCETFTSGSCFSYDQGCSNPLLGCGFGMASPCPRIWAYDGAEFGVLGALEDEAAAACVLTSLRDGVPGSYEIIWGMMGDGGWVSEWVHSAGDGTVIVEWQYDCPGCFGFGSVGRSGMLSLQPTTYFDDCLADPTPANLIQCAVGLTEYDTESPPPLGYVPPFTTGECVSLDAACP